MAKMIPSFLTEEDREDESKEYLIYDSLRKSLSDDYIVYHSLESSSPIVHDDLTMVKGGLISKEKEADFVIFHPDKGIIIIEAKYTPGFDIVDGKWRYDNGELMNGGKGPYHQVKQFVNVVKSFIDNNLNQIRDFFPISYIVWFHAMNNATLKTKKTISDTEQKHTFGKEDLINPTKKIESIFDGEAVHNYSSRRKLTEFEKNSLLDFLNIESRVFCASSYKEIREASFKRLTNEQTKILDFLDEQDEACIQGLGGTGKTVLAIQKAKRNASVGERTLFLCVNTALCNHLYNNYANPLIDFFTLNSFKNHSNNQLKRTSKPTFSDIFDYINSDIFPYKHIVVDEGQDFGKEEGILSDDYLNLIFEAFRDNVKRKNGSFYTFFDKCQCIQANVNNLPEMINHPECLLTLHKNCRNTNEIRITSVSLLEKVKKVKTRDIALSGASGYKPFISEYTDLKSIEDKINSLISMYRNRGETEITILTLNSIENSILRGSENYVYNEKEDKCYYKNDGKLIHFSTVTKFKGLESDVIILIDVNENTFNYTSNHSSKDLRNVELSDCENLMLFYVGTSRAKHNLAILGKFDNGNLRDILTQKYNEASAPKALSKLRDMIKVELYK